ncbi:MAG TPA: hypothetical protein DDY52_01475 [Candidatus Moranbacteria bacterium]|nr:hypothetical protein [Candidatus Moranbacteria bacterium]
MNIIKCIGFAILVPIDIVAAPFISSYIYLFICNTVINFIAITLPLIFGQLTVNLIINLATTELGFWICCLILICFLIKWEFKLLGIKIFFTSQRES